ncbi:MAG: bifunctional [glutamate--ammonia ligase]-adenylyl-L-tyrosine phosphorylase/[glutamate--ammonia-ligase] adenylyltransferase [Verrucomicrobia bacterium]|nr:bifunctional [glutamate--ammonia ligase]-adenylyl-L-tyrosine phosphorylase/[glutamate--ammonia-ligase] adenylyltransferase [Verrucomicrobiota bacterium]
MEDRAPLAPLRAQLAGQLIDPDAADRVLALLREVEPQLIDLLAQSGGRQTALINFLSFSPASLEKIRRRPALLEWLWSPDVSSSKQLLRDAARPMQTQPADDQNFSRLREWKSDEMLRIAFRDFSGQAGFVETTADITIVAERCVQTVLAGILAAAERRWGKPRTGIGVLAMGKFGGEELNYSSDIDLIFFYGEDGALNPNFSYHEYYTRIAQRVLDAFNAKGLPLFRLDLRLRPEGSAGPLVRSFASMEYYYSGYGESWERLALIKARGICGDQELLYEFQQRLQPFIFPRIVSPELLDEVAELKIRIERDLVGVDDLHRNVKLGFGGIREIEFTVQALQLLHGARYAFLQGRNTLKTLVALEQLQLLPQEEVHALREAYVFLRTLEHRLQMIHEQQTHTLPADPRAQTLIGRTLGFASRDAFLEHLARQTKAVRTVFERLLEGRSVASPNAVRTEFFRAPEAARQALESLAQGPATVHVSPRNKRLYRKLEPELLRWLARVADPDAALTRFVRFVDGYGIRGALFEALLANPRLLELLVRLFDASAQFSEIVIRQPQLIEEVARGRNLSAQLTTSDFETALRRNPGTIDPETWVRVYRTAELVRLVLKDVLGLASLEELQEEMTDLAEACLRFCEALSGPANGLTVLALGKFGGRELLYGADLDLVFVGDDPVAAERLIKLMNTKTSEGRVFGLDTRLRPEGESGALVVGLDQYRAYFQNRAQVWEMQSLSKARVLCGPDKVPLEETVQQIWTDAGTRRDLREKIGQMYLRVVAQREKGLDFYHLKTGRGGLMAIEFATQYLQMREAMFETNTLRGLAKLAGRGMVAETDLLAAAYRFYRQLEATLRRVDNASVSNLPSSPDDQTRLAKRVGLSSREELLDRYTHERTRVHELVSSVLGIDG